MELGNNIKELRKNPTAARILANAGCDKTIGKAKALTASDFPGLA